MSKTRTFISVAIDDEARRHAQRAIDSLRSASDKPASCDVKWVLPENLHWTLQFLGDVDDTELFDICRHVAEVATEHEPFALVAHGVGAFPSADRPRTLWLGAGEGGLELTQLQADVETSLNSLGFRGERRPFVPHLTLGRVGRGVRGGGQLSQQLTELANFEGGITSVDEITVFASDLRREGPSYSVIARAPLGGLG